MSSGSEAFTKVTWLTAEVSHTTHSGLDKSECNGPWNIMPALADCTIDHQLISP